MRGRSDYKKQQRNAAAFCFIGIAVLIFLAFTCNSCSAQETAVKGFAWDYDFADYPDSSIHFILYQKADPDTAFTVWDTTASNAIDYDIIDSRPLYNFTWREWNVTAILHTTDWSYESAPSNTLRIYFRALPPAPLDSLNGVQARYINIGDIPQL